MKKNNKGFSLVELIVVIAIMAILAAIAIPTFAHFITKANIANDEELMNNINYIFKAACLENGVDVSEVKSAAISYSENADTAMAISSVVLNDGDTELADKIESSFTLHFADMAKEKFKSKDYKAVTMIYFKDGKFDITNTGALSFTYGGAQITVNSSDIAALNGSTFGKMGMEPLLTQLNDVTTLVTDMLVGQNATLSQILASDEFLECVAKTMGIETEGVDKAVWQSQVATKYDELVVKYWSEQTPPVEAENITDDQREQAKAQIQSNALVLYTAQQTAAKKESGEFDALYSTATNKDQIISNMTNPNTYSDGVAQAAMMCGLYTAYVNQEGYEGNTTVDATTVLAALGDPESGFNAYLKTPQAQIDLDGYLASLNMVNSSTSDYKAVSSLMINGFADPELIAGLNQATGK